MTDVLIRPIQFSDNAALARVIRDALTEFGADKPGTVYFDPTTDDLFTLFRQPQSHYFVADIQGIIQGGAGIFPSPGLPEDTAELVKMYLRPEARGMGLGSILIQRCLEFAPTAGFKRIYLETMPTLRQAVKVYERFGFRFLDGPMGNTGHFGCDVWMIKDLF
jgi:putative acetyltransferase